MSQSCLLGQKARISGLWAFLPFVLEGSWGLCSLLRKHRDRISCLNTLKAEQFFFIIITSMASNPSDNGQVIFAGEWLLPLAPPLSFMLWTASKEKPRRSWNTFGPDSPDKWLGVERGLTMTRGHEESEDFSSMAAVATNALGYPPPNTRPTRNQCCGHCYTLEAGTQGPTWIRSQRSEYKSAMLTGHLQEPWSLTGPHFLI